MQKLASSGGDAGKNNVSFLSNFVLGNLHECLQILISTNRLAEAAFFCRTYVPSELKNVLPLWKEQVAKVSEKASKSLADPSEYGNLFPKFEESLEAEKMLKASTKPLPAKQYPNVTVRNRLNFNTYN